MCLIENNVKPDTDTYYKVFIQREDIGLCWLVREPQGGYSLGYHKVNYAKQTDTKRGFSVWATKESAEKACKELKKQSNLSPYMIHAVVRKVKCSGHIKSMLVPTTKEGIFSDTGKYIWHITPYHAQAFRFAEIEILD